MHEENIEIQVTPDIFARCENDSQNLRNEMGHNWIPVAVRAGEKTPVFGGISTTSELQRRLGKVTIGIEADERMRLIVEDITPTGSNVLLLVTSPRTDARDLVDAILSHNSSPKIEGLTLEAKGEIAEMLAREILSSVRASG